jgi:DNA-binding transcriptional ArsR family regulator
VGHKGGPAGEPPPPRIWLEDDLLRAGYTQCLNVLLPARKLGASDKIVFFGVISFAWQDDAAWPSIEALTARVGLHRATVLRSLAELKRVGLLKVRRRGQGVVNFYEIPRITQAVLERIAAVEPDEPDEEPADGEDLVEIEDLTEARGFTPLSNLILTARRLDAADKLVYVGLKSFAFRGRAHSRLKMRTLACRVGMSERSVQTHLLRLRATGLVTRRRRGLGRCNIYTLVRIHPLILDALQEPPYVAPPQPPPPELTYIPPPPDPELDVELHRCPVCLARLEEPAPRLVAVLQCHACCPHGLLGGNAQNTQNGKIATSSSEVADLPFSDGKPATSEGRRPAVPEVAALPLHGEDPSREDPSEETHDMSLEGGVESAAARVWYAALLSLYDVLPESAFQACFSCTEALGWEGDVFTIGAPHRFARQWIDVRYRAAAEEALAAAAGRPLQLVVASLVPEPPPARRGRAGSTRRRAAAIGAGPGEDDGSAEAR